MTQIEFNELALEWKKRFLNIPWEQKPHMEINQTEGYTSILITRITPQSKNVWTFWVVFSEGNTLDFRLYELKNSYNITHFRTRSSLSTIGRLSGERPKWHQIYMEPSIRDLKHSGKLITLTDSTSFNDIFSQINCRNSI